MLTCCRYYDGGGGCGGGDDDALFPQENERKITSGPSCTLLIDYRVQGGKGYVWVESNESAGERTMGQVCVRVTERNFNVYQ